VLQRRFKAGDISAFSALSRPHLDTLYTLCLRMTHSPVDAEDLSQETLAKALRSRRRYDPARPFRPWLLSIAANLCRDHLRTVWWRRVLPLSEQQDTTRSPERLSACAERDKTVRDALSKLPRRYREAVALFHLDDMTYAEMSQITGASVPALKQRVRRGNVMLQDTIQRLYPELLTTRS